MKKQSKTKKTRLKKQLRELVVARLSAIPQNLRMAIGSNQYTIEDLIENVQKGNRVGNQLVSMQVQYLKDLASGEMYTEFDEQQ